MKTKAIRISRTGGPEVMDLVDTELPAPTPGFVQIRHTAIGVNFVDVYHRSGLYPVPVPGGLGVEAAGVVASVGGGVSGLQAGDRVAYCSGGIGAYAEAANVPASRVVKLPAGVPDEVAAASLLKGMTVQFLFKRIFAVKPGQTILFHAAAGGVGLIACQWARHLGVKLVGTVGSKAKAALAREHGAAHTFDVGADDWVKGVRELTGGEGVPVVYDSVGKDTWARSLDCLAVRGLMVSFGNASGPPPAFEPSVLGVKGSLFLTRPSLAHYTRTPEEQQATADDFFDVLARGAVRVEVRQRFPLAEAKAAHEALEGRATTGSTILVP